MNDMLYILNQNGFIGKIWRLTKALNKNLTARVKTKAGLSRVIKRETGGKQGGKLMVPLFAKLMDTIAEDFSQDAHVGVEIDGNKIPAILFMDDLLTFSEGYCQQQRTLNAVSDFGVKHKIEWGQEKCKVMECGAHKEKQDSWQLGGKIIGNCKQYKYLGEEISRDGKNEKNFEARFAKVKTAVRVINTCGKSHIMKKMETQVLLTLHDKVTVSTLLYNSETWPLNMQSHKELDKIELWAFRRMFGLPKTTPAEAVVYCTGSIYASIRVESKQLIYLRKVLCKPDEHWAKVTLYKLKEYCKGWAHQIDEILDNWKLETDWDIIKEKSRLGWKKEVLKAAEKMNKERLINDCIDKRRNGDKQKTKTKTLIPILEDVQYERKPHPVLQENNILVARAYVMGRFGMLQCAANFSSGNGGKTCKTCCVIDDESHRINDCPLWKETNLYDSQEKIDFTLINSRDMKDTMRVIEIILRMWDLGNGRNSMRS